MAVRTKAGRAAYSKVATPSLTPHCTPFILKFKSLLRFGCFARAEEIRCQNAPFNQIIANGRRHMDFVYACPPKTAGPSWRVAGPRAATSSPLATREPCATPTPSNGFPKTARILRAADFRRAYNQGSRFAGRYFAAFCLRLERCGPDAFRSPDASRSQDASKLQEVKCDGPRLGFTVPRAFGKAVLRNRVKRRLREALRVRLTEVAPEWDIVINPRRAAIAARREELQREVDRLVAQCKKQ